MKNETTVKSDIADQPPSIHFLVKCSEPVLSFECDERPVSAGEEESLLAACPSIHLNSQICLKDVEDCLCRLFSFYFTLPRDSVTLESSLVDDIERLFVARNMCVNPSRMRLGKVFCKEDENGELAGGIEDRELLMSLVLMSDFPKLIGIHLCDSSEEATFNT